MMMIRKWNMMMLEEWGSRAEQEGILVNWNEGMTSDLQLSNL
jgi:hypothetical protein